MKMKKAFGRTETGHESTSQTDGSIRRIFLFFGLVQMCKYTLAVSNIFGKKNPQSILEREKHSCETGNHRNSYSNSINVSG